MNKPSLTLRKRLYTIYVGHWHVSMRLGGVTQPTSWTITPGPPRNQFTNLQILVSEFIIRVQVLHNNMVIGGDTRLLNLLYTCSKILLINQSKIHK